MTSVLPGLRQAVRRRLPASLALLLGLNDRRGSGGVPVARLEAPALKTMYRWLARAELETAEAHLQPLFRAATRSPQAGIEAVVVGILVCIALPNRRRAEGLLGLLEASYLPPDRDIAVARMRRRLAVLNRAALTAPFPALPESADFESFAAAVREATAGMPLSDTLQRAREERFRRGRVRQGARLPGRPPVVLFIQEGLGNQLFQYAAGLAFARRTGGRLRIDLDWYTRAASARELLLPRFRAPLLRASRWDLACAFTQRHAAPLSGIDQFMFDAPAPAWFRGFWEDAVYFQAIEPEVRRLFRPRDPAVAARAAAIVSAARCPGGQVVAMHIRRGDRAPGARAGNPGSTLPPAYYREAANRFPSGTTFLVFSDTPADIEWCREHIAPGEGYRFRFSDGLDPVLDVFTIAASDHAIIAASTFSWWGAWLGERPGRRVLAPDPFQSLGAWRVGLDAGLPMLPGWETVRFTPPDRCFRSL